MRIIAQVDVPTIFPKGVDIKGPVQMFFANEVMRKADPYVPMGSGVLKNSARVVDGGEAIEYSTPYARYHWYGKLMVDPIIGKGAFHDPISGRFWSRPNTPKVLTDRDMSYQGAPMRGPMWVDRMWLTEKESILSSVSQFIMKRLGV